MSFNLEALLAMGLTVEQVAQALSVEDVQKSCCLLFIQKLLPSG
ncbi:hypothetical protein [Microcoleus sp. bin38.metabat.b11b12b14.051]|nr:hypothetical protein [Microcoleus sp. bin38.metabat.b11b12b14.051]